MKRLKMASCFFLILLSGCDAYRTEAPHLTTPFSLETRPQPIPSDAAMTIEPLGDEGGPQFQDPIPDPTSQMENMVYRLQATSLLPEFVGDLATQEKITLYEIEVIVELDPSRVQASLKGMAKIIYTNPSPTPLSDIVLMLWPNDKQYNADMVAGPIQVDGRLVEHEIEAEGVVLRIILAEKLQPNESVEISLPFEIESEGSIRDQRKRFGITNGVLIAPTFYPLIPRLVDGEWQVEIPPEGGDTTNSDVAFYDVTITASEAFEIVASGVEVDKQFLGTNQKQVRHVTGPMRDFAFAVGDLEKISDVVNNVAINVWVLSQHYTHGKRLLNAAKMQMDFLHDLVGPYPYTELDILDTPCAFGGIEYPGLIYICSLDEGYFIDTVVHEVAHQWFYGLIGNDQIHEPWLDEASATYWQVLYYENAVGEERAVGQLNQYRSWVSGPERQTAPIGLGISDYRSSGEYYTVVYYKGALFYQALREEMGDGNFYDFLQTYFDKFRYQFVRSLDFQETAEEVCDCDLSALFDLWVYQGGEIVGW